MRPGHIAAGKLPHSRAYSLVALPSSKNYQAPGVERAECIMLMASQCMFIPSFSYFECLTCGKVAVQEVLQRLRERRQSRLHTSQQEIAGILECSEQQENMSDSGAEEGEPAAAEPRAGPPLPDQAEVSRVNMPDMEDIGDLAQQLAEADSEAGRVMYTSFDAESCLLECRR